MSPTPQDRLYKLLPSIYRVRDAAQGEPLRALLAIIEREVLAIEEDIGQLYDNWFIETCQEWVVPYLGDLLKVRDLVPVDANLFSQRAYVANTLAYRRRKGTAAMLEQLARDVTGWPARAVEFFQRVGTTQTLNHLRMASLRTPDLRDADAMELIGTPFESATRTADVRHIDNRRGTHNLHHVGVFLWRLEAFRVETVPPREVEPHSEAGVDGRGFYRFSVLGNDMPLFNPPQSEAVITTLADELNVPGRLRRRPLWDELEARRAALARGETPEARYFGAMPPFEVLCGQRRIPPEQLLICDLSTWHRPPAWPGTKDGDGRFFVAVDPVLGRLAFPEGHVPDTPHVSYSYGFSGEVGGGFYDRRDTLPSYEDRRVFRVLTAPPPGEDDRFFATLEDAWTAWADTGGQQDALIEILDSERYTLTGLVNPGGRSVELRAANQQRPVIELPSSGCSVEVDAEASILFNGLLMEGGPLFATMGEGSTLELRHCTLVPGQALQPDGSPWVPSEPGLEVVSAGGTVSLSRCITGPLVAGRFTTLRLVECIVDGLRGRAIRPLGLPPVSARLTGGGHESRPFIPRDEGEVGRLSVVASTVLGSVEATVLELASNAVFTGVVTVVQRQEGCARFSYLPQGSRTPRRFHCQPASAEDETHPEVEPRVRPFFTSERYGDPGYCQLREDVDAAIQRGASDEGEMGVFHHLQQPQREANLRASLTDYLRFGLDAGTFFVT